MRIITRNNRNLDLSNFNLTDNIIDIQRIDNDDLEEDQLITDFRTFFEVKIEVIEYNYRGVNFIIDLYGRKHKFCPPFILMNYDRSLEIINIKEISTIDASITQVFKKYCIDLGIKFIEYKYEDFKHSNELHNSNFLLKYKRPGYGFDYNRMSIVNKTLREHKSLTIQNILDYSVKNEDNKILLLYTIWVMIVHKSILFDFSTKLSMKTKVYL
ncbi:MAG: hypothetical protein N4A45_07115 [Flavobacteriales bacterium]|jgi:hypothetical protein|nr:hypothetical protein [Flavobacteriales bacterium]